jgi:hypothetical protein
VKSIRKQYSLVRHSKVQDKNVKLVGNSKVLEIINLVGNSEVGEGTVKSRR